MGLFVRNEGTVDRIIRAVIGVVALVLAFTTLTEALQIIAIIVGILMLFTAATGSCMLYRVLGINTCSLQQRS